MKPPKPLKLAGEAMADFYDSMIGRRKDQEIAEVRPSYRPTEPWMKALAKEYSSKSHDREWQKFTYDELIELLKKHAPRKDEKQ